MGAGGWRWLLAVGCCEVWQLCRVQAGQAAGLRGHRCGAGAAGGLLLAGGAGGRGDLLRWWCAGVVIGHAARSSGRAAADPAGRAGVQAAGRGRWAKEKGQGRRRGVRCCSGLWSALAVVICCAGRIPVQAVGCGDLLPVPVPGPLLALALFQAQRFQLATFQRVTGAAAGAPSWPFLAVCRRGQILHLTGLRSRCRALT